jgi:hypothetical protein
MNIQINVNVIKRGEIMSKFFFNHHSATVEDVKLIEYAEAIYGKSGRSVLENLMAKASIRLRDRYPHKTDEQISHLVNQGLYELFSKYVEE